MATRPAIGRLRADGRIFRTDDGSAWRWKGVTAFKLCELFRRGTNVRRFLQTFAQLDFNIVRVFAHAVGVGWEANGWETPPADVVLKFGDYAAGYGIRTEYVLLTDDAKPRIDVARRQIEAFAKARPPWLVLESGNEPTTHKAIDTAALREALAASGILHSSGDYEEGGARHYGDWLNFHSGRDADWPARAHEAVEYFAGGGPHSPSDRAHRVPAVADEPAKPTDVTGDREADFRAYFAACAILGAGATYHYEGGKFGRLPDQDELSLARVVSEALNLFPADAPLGVFRRIDDESLRTFAVGGFMVRVRPRTKTAPEPGWTPLDDRGICWKR